jgi:hypothetical protein
MSDPHAGSSLWTRFEKEDVEQLRRLGRAALIRSGMTPGQLALYPHEVDKWLESRLESTLDEWLRFTKERNL